MRIAINSTGDVGRRAGLILLAERDLVALGRYGESAPTGDRRTLNITTLDGYGVLVTDDPSPGAIARIAAEDGVSCVVTTSVDADVAAAFTAAGKTLMTGADLRGIATTLAVHEAAHLTGEVAVTAAWTVAGPSLRKGVAVGFPEPVGARWGRTVDGGIEVPIAGSWAAAAATVSGIVDGRRTERLVGVADVRDHLAAIALAAGALVVARGQTPPGVVTPADAATPFLAAALSCGMGVAAYTV